MILIPFLVVIFTLWLVLASMRWAVLLVIRAAELLIAWWRSRVEGA